MYDVLALTPVFCGGLLAGCIMYTVKNPRLRDSQGKVLGFMLVVLAVGMIIILSGYRGLISNPFTAFGSQDHVTVRVTSPQTEVNGGNQLISGVKSEIILSVLKPQYVYGIMFDAGSTGSRVHVFKFKKVAPGKPFEFVEELFEKVQPGLSAYANEPKKAADSLRGMLDKAKKYIPKDLWATTPIALKATAGLRKLKEEEADNILNEIQQLFVEYPFKQENDSVVIMEGTDEGVFSWFTVNYYSGVLGEPSQMTGVMDLGGGSTQITFTPNDPNTISSAPPDYIIDKNILGKMTKIYTHSYLDLGLMAGRLQIMGGKVGSDVSGPLPTLSSACLPDGYEGKIVFGQDEYLIKAVQPQSSRFEECYVAAKSVISKYNLHTTPEIQEKSFCTISYYYDRANEAGLVEGEKGGYVKTEEFFRAAKRVCLNPTNDLPFLCLDLCYISSLLEDGFKISSSVPLNVQKKIGGQEISWALGAMFDFFSNHHYS